MPKMKLNGQSDGRIAWEKRKNLYFNKYTNNELTNTLVDSQSQFTFSRCCFDSRAQMSVCCFPYYSSSLFVSFMYSFFLVRSSPIHPVSVWSAFENIVARMKATVCDDDDVDLCGDHDDHRREFHWLCQRNSAQMLLSHSSSKQELVSVGSARMPRTVCGFAERCVAVALRARVYAVCVCYYSSRRVVNVTAVQFLSAFRLLFTHNWYKTGLCNLKRLVQIR